MTTVTAAEAFVTQLESYGVEYVFGTCGHTNIALLDALGPSTVHFVIARHEQAAAHAADGYARASGKPGVLLTHVGPGMMNAVTGVATAAMDSVPLIVISGDIPSYYYGRHPHQEVNLHADADQTAIYRPFCKRAWPVQRTADLPRTLERAFWTATSGRPGAVLVNVPMDLFSRQVEPYVPGSHAIPDSALPGLTEETAERIARALIDAERPLIYFGGGLRTPDAKQALLALADHLDIPLAHSLMGKGAIPDRHPLLLGMPGFWGLDSTHAHTKDADVVLALATRFAETDASSWEAAYTWNFPPSKLIQIDIDPAEIGRNYPVEIGAVADVGHSVRAIEAAVRALQPEPTRRPGLRETIAAGRAELFSTADENGASDNFPLRPQRILADLRANLPADAILVTDVGWNKNGVAQSYDLPPEGRFITPGGASTMGFGPAAAVGVQMAQPQRTVVALIGDGGMSAQLPAVPMAVEQGLPVIFAVMNNRAHGTISDLQRSNYGRGYGCDFTGPDGAPYSPDFAAYGRSCGADGYEVSTAEELAKALATAVERRRPAVIDIPMVNEPVPTPGHWNINDIYQGKFQDEG
ncbi:thiamine pyrophosphate-binding protein [Streptomyces poriferorum]|uniref:Thiamine pyrophosphate-binding protein n=1 Tax=Streptomyces poriferorum TaxID=2798799 RepID=A0ABY9IIZ5_9ACTN|nr:MULTISPECIES: thiamine pyrophosphate-binding protein [Streptomyces]MBW5248378.1 thiamine pyrophosphate-binding protein [Streptomyces poriferorum]MBW5255660.1 thiamine pyrophosphate-binding protein [Streptomyces poriferorum]MDP5316952.1 thiamine pyrophosphate-binding protein [Streptomyces sp. Alt4]WLQ52016.1 thiamine pyrophosphate-binding protein [Streptomyces sp. Alt1]WLQ55233.1 thiamine pyrophosphate-binding protein [Streptomyces sp. Alt2]